MLTSNQIKEIVKPIAEKYRLEAVYLFGSQARGETSPESDYVFYIKHGKTKDLFELIGLFIELKFENLDDNLVDIINRNDIFHLNIQKKKQLYMGRN